MRAGHGTIPRYQAARNSWNGRPAADRLPTDDPAGVDAHRPADSLCINTVRVAGTIADTGFDELRDLCSAACDTVSLAIGMAA